MAFIPQHYRYSPVNWLIVPWNNNGHQYEDCGLPLPAKRKPNMRPEFSPECCEGLPVEEAIDTYDWGRWLPEVMVGIDSPEPEIAASYVRETAIEFAERSQVLLRRAYIQLQPNVTEYPLEPYVGERIVGVIETRPVLNPQYEWIVPTPALGFKSGVFDPARNTLTVHHTGDCGTLEVLVWATPTEDSCAQDVFLYNNYRRQIAQTARARYALAVHFRDRELMRTLRPVDMFDNDIRLARVKAARSFRNPKPIPRRLF